MSYVPLNTDNTAYAGTKFGATKEYVLMSLGWPLVRVELTEKHIITAIIDALQLWHRYAATNTYVTRILYVEQGNVVTIPSDINPDMLMDVILPLGTFDAMLRGLGTIELAEGGYSYAIAGSGAPNLMDNFDMVGYWMYLQRLEDLKKVMGIDPSWDIVNGKINLYPIKTTYDRVCALYKAVASEAMSEAEQWIRDYALAKAKHMLGTVRAKMSGFQITGGNLAADADSLKSEGKEEMTALREDLMKKQQPLPLMQI